MPYHIIKYWPTPTTDLGLYLRLRDKSAGQVWNTDTEELETWDDVDIPDYAVAGTYLGGNAYGFNVPDQLPTGENYNGTFHVPTVIGTPALSDLKHPDEWDFSWNGSLISTPPGPGAPASQLITDYQKFIRRWGLKNVTAVSDKDHAGSIQTDVIQDAFDYADAEVYRHMMGGSYLVPLEFESSVDPSVEEWAFIIAYSHLYYGRFDDALESEEDVEEARALATKVKNLIKTVHADMLEVRMGFKQIAGATAGTSVDMQPQVVSEYDVRKNVLDDYNH